MLTMHAHHLEDQPLYNGKPGQPPPRRRGSPARAAARVPVGRCTAWSSGDRRSFLLCGWPPVLASWQAPRASAPQAPPFILLWPSHSTSCALVCLPVSSRFVAQIPVAAYSAPPTQPFTRSRSPRPVQQTTRGALLETGCLAVLPPGFHFFQNCIHAFCLTPFLQVLGNSFVGTQQCFVPICPVSSHA